MNTGSVQDQLLAEQRAYYSALAPEYLDFVFDLPGGAELTDALDAFRAEGSVLELACGPGVWTHQLLRHASDVTAVDASPEMLAIAASRVPGDAPVRFIEADLFTWEPDRRYDVVFMGFWLSHVPAERFGSFWALVAAALAPRGRVFFTDDAYRTPDELIEGPASSTIQRRTPDGTAYRIVKVPHEPADLERQLRELGWDITVTPTVGPFFWGAGGRARTLARGELRRFPLTSRAAPRTPATRPPIFPSQTAATRIFKREGQITLFAPRAPDADGGRLYDTRFTLNGW
jgi:SAM-dependent methyltransferase